MLSPALPVARARWRGLVGLLLCTLLPPATQARTVADAYSHTRIDIVSNKPGQPTSTSTSYGDASPSVDTSYTADGLPQTISSGNFAWLLGYNNHRLLTVQALNVPQGDITLGYAFTHGIDSHGNLASLAYPGGPTIHYSPDALGRPTQVWGYAAAISHHPNGQLAGYTAANGIVHSVTQNLRGLPAQMHHAGVVQDLYSFDARKNRDASRWRNLSTCLANRSPINQPHAQPRP